MESYTTVSTFFILEDSNLTLNQQQREEIENLVKKEIDETLHDIESLEDQVKPIAPDNAIGRLSRMEAIGAKSINEAALTRAREKLRQLKAVLEYLDDPDFGLCIECDEEIPIKRIMLMPGSRMCVKCASSIEKSP